MKDLWYPATTTTPLQDRHIIILIKVDEKEKLNFFKGLMLAPPFGRVEPKADGIGFQVYRKIDFPNLMRASCHYSLFIILWR